MFLLGQSNWSCITFSKTSQWLISDEARVVERVFRGFDAYVPLDGRHWCIACLLARAIPPRFDISGLVVFVVWDGIRNRHQLVGVILHRFGMSWSAVSVCTSLCVDFAVSGSKFLRLPPFAR